MKRRNLMVTAGAVVFMIVLSVTGDCASKVEREALLKAVSDKYSVMIGSPISSVSISSMKCSKGDSGKWAEVRACVRSGSKFHELIAKIGATSNPAPIETTVSSPEKALVCVGFL